MQNATDAYKGAIIKIVLGLVFLGIGAWVVWLAVSMVGVFGEGMGVDARSKQIYSHAHIAVHIFGTASSIAVGLFFALKRWGLGLLCLLAIVGAGTYGVSNMIGFTSTNRLSVAASRDAANNADWVKYNKAREAIQGSIDWAHRTLTEEDSPREKTRIRAYVDKKTAELAAIEPPKPTADRVLADSQATWFSKLSGVDAATWQLALPVPVAILMAIAEVLSFIFAMALIVNGIEGWYLARASVPREPREPKSGSGGGSAGSGGGSGGGRTKPALVRETDKVSAEPLRVPAAAPSKFSSAELDDYVARMSNGALSLRDLAKITGWSHPTILRRQRKLQRRADAIARRAQRSIGEGRTALASI